MGQMRTYKLEIPSDMSRICMMHSSKPSVLWFPDNFSKPFPLYPGNNTICNFHVQSLTPKIQFVQVNCVDFQSNKLLYGWVVRVDTEPPKPSQVVYLETTVNALFKDQFKFQNKLPIWCIYNFKSSDSSVLRVTQAPDVAPICRAHSLPKK